MKETLMTRLFTYALYVIFVLGAAMVASLPLMLDVYLRFLMDAYIAREGYRLFIIIFCMAVGALGLWIIGEMALMMRSVKKEPFVMRNVRALRRIGVVAFAAALMFFAKCVMWVTFLTIGCGIVLVICALFAFTLSHLIHQAVIYKEENELTI